MKTLAHVASRFVNSPLMMHPPKLEVIISALGPRLGIDPRAIEAVPRDATTTLMSRYADAENERDYAVVDGIACIPVCGTLLKRDSWMNAYSGCASYEEIRSQIESAASDGGVRGILLDIDSPGGEVNGCFELSDYIYSLRGVKPIYAAANDIALSAAYAIASAADKIFVTRTGAVGSIGVYALHTDQSAFDQQIGVKYTYVFAGSKKVDGNPHAPISDRAKADIQAEVDREYKIFTATAARNRKAAEPAITATQAGLLWADDAIPLLADKVGTCEDALQALRAAVGAPVSVSMALNPRESAALVAEDTISTAAAAAESQAGETPMGDRLEPQPNAANSEDTPAGEAATPCTATQSDDADEEELEDEEEKDEEEQEEQKETVMENSNNAALASVQGQLLQSAPSRSESDILAIGAFCKLAGCAERVTEFLTKKDAKGNLVTLAEISDELQSGRVAESEKTVINSNHNPLKGGAASIEALLSEATTYARQNKGVTREQAFTEMIEAHPEVYGSYRAQHNAKDLVRTLEAAGYRLTPQAQ